MIAQLTLQHRNLMTQGEDFHELRTPLAIQRAAIEIGLDDPSPDQLVRMREELLRANLRTERLIDGLLVLAQGERGLDGREPVSLDVLAEEVADHHRDAAVALPALGPVPARVGEGEGLPVTAEVRMRC
jgi:signal transduction histidine kinase